MKSNSYTNIRKSVIGASAVKPHMDDISGIFHICIRDCGSNLYVGMRVVEMF